MGEREIGVGERERESERVTGLGERKIEGEREKYR